MNKPCSFPGCTNKTYKRYICPAHARQKKLGQVLRPVRALRTGDDLQSRLAGRTERLESGCLVWTGLTSHWGYGRIVYKGQHWHTHRLVYAEAHGPLRDDQIVCHKCDNPPCIEIGHLFLGTHQTNAEDKVSKGRHPSQGKTHCNHGHEYTPENTQVAPLPSGRFKRVCRACAREGYRRRQRLKHQTSVVMS